MIYYVVFWGLLITAFFSVIDKRLFKYFDAVFFNGWVLILFMLSATRLDTGYDYKSYEMIFENIHQSRGNLIDIIENNNIELSYCIISYVCPNFRTVIMVYAFLGIIVKCVFFAKRKDRILCLFLYYANLFIFYDMGVIRQGVAIGIIFFALHYIKERNIGKYIMMIIIASLFHTTAIIALPLYFLSDKCLGRKIYYFSIAGSILLSSDKVLLVINNALQKAGVIKIAWQMEYYLQYSDIHKEEMISTATIIKRILLLIIFVEYYMTKKRENMNWLYINGYYLSVLMLIVFKALPILAGRGTFALYCMQIFLFADMIYTIHKLSRKIFLIIMISALMFNSMQGLLYSQMQSFFPYQSVIFYR